MIFSLIFLLGSRAIWGLSVGKQLDAVDNCRADNWGMPNQSRRPFLNTYTADVQERCKNDLANMIPMSQKLDNAMVNYYKNNPEFDAFVGVDWVPENHYMFKPFSTWGSKLDTTSFPKGAIKASTCDTELADGSTWTVTRIGPFKTTGGYDWVQMGWDNLWDLREKLQRFPDGIYVTDQISAPVLADGTRLGNPPIHIHHIHMGPSTGVRQRADHFGCLLHDKGCYDPTRVFEHHGDYQCIDADGGLDCLTESVPDGYGKLITMELGLEGDLNDVRFAGAPELEWYYELGARWVPKNQETAKKLKAMSFHNFAGPGNFDMTRQSSYIFTYQAPTDAESFFWYTGHMHHTGKLLRNKQHAHNVIFDEAIFFAATPQQLGLTVENNLMPPRQYDIIKTKKAGFDSNVKLKEFVLNNLKKSQEAYDKKNNEKNKMLRQAMQVDGFEHLNQSEARLLKASANNAPRPICQSITAMEMVDGRWYDRKEPICCQEWEFHEGDIFTVLAFHKKVNPDTFADSEHKELPPTFPGHVGFWLSYDTQETPEKSHFSIIQYTHDSRNQFENMVKMSMEHKLSTNFYGGTITDQTSLIWRIATVISLIVKNISLITIIVAVLVLGKVAIMLRPYLYANSKSYNRNNVSYSIISPQ